MHITFLVCNTLALTNTRFCFKTLEKYIIRIPSLKMYQKRNNTFISKTEPNQHRNTQHCGDSSSFSLLYVHNKRNPKRGCEHKESISERHNINTNNFLNNLQKYPYVLNNDMIPFTNSHQHFTSSSSSFNMQQNYNYVSFRSRTNNTADKRCTTSNGNARTWKNTKFGTKILSSSANKRAGIFFSIMNYNVLAQDLLEKNQHIYKKHVKTSLNWEQRWQNLLKEITEHDCDILCLQEVQESHMPNYYNNLQKMGYNGLYKRRTGDKTDGCAIYYKANLFKLVEYITVEYFQPNVEILNRDNVAIIAKFAPLKNLSSKFIVATTHLLYNPRREDVRLAQSQVLLCEVERMAFNPNTNEYLPIIITGDFNSTPRTTIFNLLSTGYANYTPLLKQKHNWISNQLQITDNCQHANLLQYRQKVKQVNRNEEFKLIRLQHSERNIVKEPIRNGTDYSIGKISHNFNFKSVYEINMEQEGTTFQDEWVIVDYVFYSGRKSGNKIMDNNLILLSYYTLPRGNELNSLIIPNENLGSDHLSLVAKFKLEY